MNDSFKERVNKVKAMSDREVLAELDRHEQDTLKLLSSEPVECKSFNHGRYFLDVTVHPTKEGCWHYSKGMVTDHESADHETIVVPRNYGTFWHLFVDHPNGMQYLLCGHDYQGYDCVNLTRWERHKYVPREALYGAGFCWAEVRYDREKTQLVVDGCFWACPYEIVRYDFSDPDVLPYKELSRKDVVDDDDEEEIE